MAVTAGAMAAAMSAAVIDICARTLNIFLMYLQYFLLIRHAAFAKAPHLASKCNKAELDHIQAVMHMDALHVQ